MNFNHAKLEAIERRSEQLRAIASAAGDARLRAKDNLQQAESEYQRQREGRRRAGFEGIQQRYPRLVREARAELERLTAECGAATQQSRDASAVLDRCNRWLADHGVDVRKAEHEPGDYNVVFNDAEVEDRKLTIGIPPHMKNEYLNPPREEDW